MAGDDDALLRRLLLEGIVVEMLHTDIRYLRGNPRSFDRMMATLSLSRGWPNAMTRHT